MEQAQIRGYRSLKLAGLLPVILIPCFLLPLIVLNPPRAFIHPTLSSLLSLVFQGVIPLSVAFIAAKAYLKNGLSSVLFLGSALLCYGTGCMISASWVEITTEQSINFLITVHNISLFLASILFAMSSLSTLRETTCAYGQGRKHLPALAATYTTILLLTVLVCLATYRGFFPEFFNQGHGQTPVREVVLLCTIILLAVSSSIIMIRHFIFKRSFHYWYALSLLLLVAGTFGIYFQTSFGSALNWTARISQYLGVSYLLFSMLSIKMGVRREGLSVFDLFTAFFSAESDRKRAEEQLKENEERLLLAIDTANLGFFDWNTRTGQVFLSSHWKKQLGYADEEIANRFEEFEARLHPEEREGVLEKLRACVTEPSSSFEGEFRLRHRDGSYRTLYTRAVLLEDDFGARCRLLGTNLDITERKGMEEKLRQAKEAAETANQAKSEFLANMSHELRTPMNGILGMTHLALQRELPKDARSYLLLAQQSGQALLEIINDVLDLSKIEAGKVALDEQPFDLDKLVESTLKPLELLAREKGLSFFSWVDPQVPRAVVGDGGRLRQILTNVVGNAIKFTSSGAVAVTVGLAETADPPHRASLLFVVKDDGIGIPADKLGSIFENFELIPSSAHIKYGGTGLGLSISKQLVEMMHGRIWAESEPGRGSTFRFVVELGRAEPADAAPQACPPEPQEDAAPLRILLAEDNEINSLFAVHLLERWGHRVEVAANGQLALEKLRSQTYDLVLMDALMPVMDGERATRLIRSGQAGDPAVPIIAMTAYALDGDRERFLACGMDDYIAKPIDIKDLTRVLARATRSKSPNRT